MSSGVSDRFVGEWLFERVSSLRRTHFVRACSVVAFLGLWWAISLFYDPFFLPGPREVVTEVVYIVRYDAFITHLAQTLTRVVIAFGIGLMLAVAIGIVMGVSKTGEQFFETFVIVGLTMPAVAVTVIMLMVLGMNNTAAIATIVFVITPLMTENIWEGTKNIDRDLVQMAQVFNPSWPAVLRSVVLPQLVPYVLAASRFGLGAAWKIVVIAEFFGLGDGIGYKINESFELFSLSGVLAWTLSFVILMTIIEFGIIKQVEKRLTQWRGDEGSERIGVSLFQT
ncbi:ABC transporter permease [Natrinema salifodinae]|uniref:NitT/TauT family transport system permease protein n=1 Tax=Natrinema salifodinae TaxID=1202768 RepID=A0A1I0P3Q2_9EURY|nr:ABC transporter permease [Natrinema salifodinae]SEW08993.1 NitT/TauT family transport system permease protein [Natrinema salifodinae]